MVLEPESDMMAETQGKQEEALELALTPGPLHMCFLLYQPLMPEQARLAPSAHPWGSYHLLQGLPCPHLQVLSKRENERCTHPAFFSAPFSHNLYHQLAIHLVFNDISV